MTMLLMNVVWFPVTPVADKEGWFEVAGRAVLTCESDVLEYIEAFTHLEGARVLDAKLVGMHDNEDIMSDDPRFNYENDEEDEPGFGVVRFETTAGGLQYRGVMMVNAPEQVLFEHARDKWDEPENADQFPSWKAGAREAAEAHFRDRHVGFPQSVSPETPAALRQKAHEMVDAFIANRGKPAPKPAPKVKAKAAPLAKPRGKVRAQPFAK